MMLLEEENFLGKSNNSNASQTKEILRPLECSDKKRSISALKLKNASTGEGIKPTKRLCSECKKREKCNFLMACIKKGVQNAHFMKINSSHRKKKERFNSQKHIKYN
jgi:hypothetical protein